MKIRFLIPFRRWRPDEETDWADGAANVLIARGIAREVVEGEKIRSGGEDDQKQVKSRPRGQRRQ